MEQIKYCRELKGLSRLDLATETGLNYETIARYERGDREPNATNLKVIADVLGVTTDELFK